MPRKQDFSQSVIYHIRNIETKKVIYVGSTTNLIQRKAKHIYICNKESNANHNFPLYCFIRENGGFNNFEVIPVSILNLQNKVQLVIEEQNEIDKHNDLQNIKKSYQSEADRRKYLSEWNKSNQDRRNQQSIENYSRNKFKQNEIIQCPICHFPSTRGHLNRHQRTKNCLHTSIRRRVGACKP